jgi:hypothetical protein
MKTLLITGVYFCESQNLPVLYDIDLWGQTDKTPEITFITHMELSLNGYDALMKVCGEKYCSYMGVDDNNITHLDMLYNAKDYFKYNQ